MDGVALLRSPMILSRLFDSALTAVSDRLKTRLLEMVAVSGIRRMRCYGKLITNI